MVGGSLRNGTSEYKTSLSLSSDYGKLTLAILRLQQVNSQVTDYNKITLSLSSDYSKLTQ